MVVVDSVQSQMLPLLAKTSVQVNAEAEQRSGSAAQLQLNPGEQVKAEILSSLSNHLYLARVAGEMFKLEIPLIVQPGQSLPMTVVNVQPRLVFELRRPQGGQESVEISFLGRRLADNSGAEGAPPFVQEGVPAESLPEPPAAATGGSPLAEDPLLLPSEGEQQGSVLKLGLAPGQQVKGEVVQAAGKNLYLIKVDGESFKLELPQELRPGESVPLTLVTTHPQVLFQLNPADGTVEPVRLSTLGKWLATPGAAETLAQVRQDPLLNHPAHDPSLLSARLKEALTTSGLFYEAHLAKWAAGAFSLAELFKEPQGRLSKTAPGKRDSDASDKGENGIADDSTLPLVKEQLSLLSGGVLTWKGEAWPGQHMALTVTERGAQGDEPGVQATLSLELPHLGEVRGKVHFGPHGVAVELSTDNEASCRLLKGGGEEFAEASAANGVRLSRVSVRHDEKDE